MKRILDFLTTCAVGGLFALLPLLVFFLLMKEALGVVIALATPLADLFPAATFDEMGTPALVLVAFALILAASFLFGLLLRSRALTRYGSWLEQRTLTRLPMYSAVKRMTAGFGGSDLGFRSAVLSTPDGVRQLVYLIEEHRDGRSTVLIPMAPAAFTGFVQVVPSSWVEILEVGIGDASRVISLWGFGMAKLLPETGPENNR